MKISIRNLRRIIRETIEEELDESRKDRDDDGDEDFADVMMARMQAGGVDDEEAYKKSRKHDR
jgi:hypothetical protein